MNEPRRILFITLSCLGDAILTTPTLKALHLKYPDARFDIVAHPRCLEVFSRFPYVESLFEKGAEQGLSDHFKLLLQLRRIEYDLIVDLRTDGYSYLLKGKKRLLKKSNFKTRNMHAAEKHFEAIRKIVLYPSPGWAIVYVEQSHEVNALKLIRETNIKRTLAIGCGGSIDNRWPLTNFIALIKLACLDGWQIILIGNKEQESFSREIEEGVPYKIKNMVGKTSILEAGSILKYCDLFIGTDSGLGHLASAVSCKTITIFGGDNPRRCKPWSKNALTLQSKDKNTSDISPMDVFQAMK